MRIRQSRLLGALAVCVLLVSACGSTGDDPGSGPEIIIGSFAFGESEILGEIYAQGLRDSGYRVTHRPQMGSREIVKPALESGEIGLVPEYVGSAVEVGFQQLPSVNGEAAREMLAELFSGAGVTVLDLAPAEDVNTFGVLRETAEQHGLVTVSDLIKLGTISLGGPPECPTRPRCKLGLENTYDLRVEFTPLDAGGPLTLGALRRGEIDVGLFLSTFIFDEDIVALADDRGLQPAENVVPVIRTELVEAHGDALTDRINAISAQITTESLIELNRRFDAEQRSAADIAAEWLREAGLVAG